MNLLVEFLKYFLISCIEWILAGRRMNAMRDQEMIIAPILVFFEGIIAWYLIDGFTGMHNWTIAISTSLGGSLGVLLEMLRRKYILKKKKQISP